MEGEIKNVVWHRSGVSNVGSIFSVVPYCDLISMKLPAKISLVVFLFYTSNCTQVLPSISFPSTMSWVEPSRIHFTQKRLLVEILFSGM